MKMMLFRPTFVTAGMIFQLVALLCALVAPVYAVPQFGRPMLHVLDDSPTGIARVDPASGTVKGGVAPVVAPTPAPANDQVNAANTDASSTSTSSIAATPSLVNTNSASHRLGGIHPALLLSGAAATSAIFLVF